MAAPEQAGVTSDLSDGIRNRQIVQLGFQQQRIRDTADGLDPSFGTLIWEKFRRAK